MLSSFHLSVCLSSVYLSETLVRPTQPVEIFGNVFTPVVAYTSADFHAKFYGDLGTPPTGVKRNRGSQI